MLPLLRAARPGRADSAARLRQVAGGKERQVDEYGQHHASGLYSTGRIILNLWRLLRDELKLRIYTFEACAAAVLQLRTPRAPPWQLAQWFRGGATRWRCVAYWVRRARLSLAMIEQLDLARPDAPPWGPRLPHASRPRSRRLDRVSTWPGETGVHCCLVCRLPGERAAAQGSSASRRQVGGTLRHTCSTCAAASAPRLLVARRAPGRPGRGAGAAAPRAPGSPSARARPQVGRTAELARTFGIDFFAVLFRGSQYRVESMMARLAHTQNYLLPSPSKEQVAGPMCLMLPRSMPCIV